LFVFEICISYHLAVFALQRTKKPAFNYIFLTFFDHFDLITVVAKPHQLYLLFKPIYALYKLRLCGTFDAFFESWPGL